MPDNQKMARALRLAVTRNVWMQGILTDEQAKDILRGRLSPDDPSSECDDSDLLDLPASDALEVIWDSDDLPDIFDMHHDLSDLPSG